MKISRTELKFLWLALAWGLCLIVPHFQTNPNLPEFILDLNIFLILSFSLFSASKLNFLVSNRLGSLIWVASLSLFPFVFMFFVNGQNLPYAIWNRLGAGSMRREGKIVPFGDLIHLTAAASCPNEPIVGAQVCDPWGRTLNQNPLVVSLLKFLHFTNISIFGLSSYLLFAAVVFTFAKKLDCNNFILAVFLLSPPIVLAMDRGNELITLLFILSGLLLIGKNSKLANSFGAILILFSVIFKLWPIILVGTLIFFSGKMLRAHVKVLLGLSIIYWLFNWNTALALLKATQHGSPFGNSFGFKLFWNSGMSAMQATMLILITVVLIAFYLVRFPIEVNQFRQEMEKVKFGHFLLPFFATFVAIWAVGESFSYRAIVLLPVVLILSQKDLAHSHLARNLLQMILVTLLAARLPIFISISSALGIYLAIFIAKYLIASLVPLPKKSLRG